MIKTGVLSYLCEEINKIKETSLLDPFRPIKKKRNFVLSSFFAT